MKKSLIIESGVPRTPNFGRGYPWTHMEVGDSVSFEKGDANVSAAHRATHRWSPKKFESGFDPEGKPRVWRTA